MQNLRSLASFIPNFTSGMPLVQCIKNRYMYICIDLCFLFIDKSISLMAEVSETIPLGDVLFQRGVDANGGEEVCRVGLILISLIYVFFLKRGGKGEREEKRES